MGILAGGAGRHGIQSECGIGCATQFEAACVMEAGAMKAGAMKAGAMKAGAINAGRGDVRARPAEAPLVQSRSGSCGRWSCTKKARLIGADIVTKGRGVVSVKKSASGPREAA